MDKRKKLILAGALLVMSHGPAAMGDDAQKIEPTRLQIDVSSADAGTKWREAVTLLEKCTPLDVQLWYSFGSARLRATPAPKSCRIELALEVEMDKQAYSCTLPSGTKWSWNLVSDGKNARQAPPRDLPPELVGHCKKG